MGINVEFTPDLALRNIEEFRAGRRLEDECLPENLVVGETYNFLKKGQRLFWFSDDPAWSSGQLPLSETTGNNQLARPIASVKILEATHFLKKGEVYTRGKYQVMEIFNDEKVHFESYRKI